MFANTFSQMLKVIAYKVLPAGVQRVLSHWFKRSTDTRETMLISHSCGIIEGKVSPELLHGWQDPAVAERQHAAFTPLLRQMYGGKPREDFITVATAVQMTGLEEPFIIEVGCGSGWNSEVLAHFLKHPVHYIGLDYSPAMVDLGKQCYPNVPFVVGDAVLLPFRDGICDILLSGTVLMHVLDYGRAIQESRRVTRRWCIFHTVPVVQKRPTTVLRKFAYGSLVVEIFFNEEELLQLIHSNGFSVFEVLESVPYDLVKVVEETTKTRTYICKVE